MNRTQGSAPAAYLMVEWSGGGGFGHYAWLLADAISQQDRPVTLCTRAGHELEQMPHRHRVFAAWARSPRRLRGRARSTAIAGAWLWGWLRVLGLAIRLHRTRGVIHLQATGRLVEAPFVLVARALGWTVISTAHNAIPHDASRWQRTVQRLLYRLPHGIVCHSETAAEQIRKAAEDRTCLLVVRHPSYAPIAEWSQRGKTRRQARRRVLHFGAIRPYKRLDLVVDAVARTIEAFPDVEFRIAGRPDNRAAVEALMRRLPTESVSAQLSHLGLAELLSELDQADVVMLGHRSESESGVAHLALGAGVPIVAPTGGPIGRLLESRPEWTYSGGDPVDGARALVALLSDISTDKDATQTEARRLAAAVPSWELCATRHLDFVENVLRP
jgi:glycosyltransferase involved in cell wall biosynthesis